MKQVIQIEVLVIMINPQHSTYLIVNDIDGLIRINDHPVAALEVVEVGRDLPLELSFLIPLLTIPASPRCSLGTHTHVKHNIRSR